MGTYYFKIAVALAVAAIPEGLPAVITTCLALGTRKMAKQKAIVRKLPSVETLGCTSVICSDKTGTLTSNQMSCVEVVVASSSASGGLLQRHQVSGHTYDPRGGQVIGLNRLNESWECLMRICSLCNEASVEEVEDQTDDGSEGDFNVSYKAVGSPTEAALKVLAEKIGSVAMSPGTGKLLPCNDSIHDGYEKQAVLEFNRDRKSMSVLVANKNSTKRKHKNELMVKGAPESVLARCTHFMQQDGTRVLLTKKTREEIAGVIQDMSKKALRCLAMALKDDPKALGDLSSYDSSPDHPAHGLLKDIGRYGELESKLCFVGIAGLQDPPRPEVKHSIECCQDAGIRVIVITGDNQLTAESICRDIGIFGDDDEFLEDRSFTCSDFFSPKLSNEKRHKILTRSHASAKQSGLLFSRAEPKHKQDIIRLLKLDGNDVIAMTGDGVNDAPALALADIGIAMGIAGTEVAKEASDMVLADDNFSTIVSAVREGRAIYNNMKAFIRYMISSNVGEVASIFITAALGLPEGLIPVQLLWVNLVTDGPPATALGFNPPDPDVMRRPPRGTDDVLINNWVFFRYMVIGMYVGFATVGVFVFWFVFYVDFIEYLGEDMMVKLHSTYDGHSMVTYEQLTHWGHCSKDNDGLFKDFKVNDFDANGDGTVDDFSTNPCKYFSDGKVKASTLSLSVLVTIEMFNALNAISEDGSLVTMPPWVNPWLLLAMAMSFGLHFVILYVPALATVFSIAPHNSVEWILVLAFSFPVIIIDELLKMVGRIMNARERAERLAKDKQA